MVRTRSALAAALVVLSISSTALAGNMFLPFRGARAMGRGGAMTAGSDDGDSIYYNPAGLADIDSNYSLLVDGALIFQRASYTRVDSGGNPQPRVDGSMNLLPIPTLVFTFKPPVRHRFMNIAIGVWTPYLGLDSWPENGPQRYSNVTLNGSILTVLEAAISFRITDWLDLGAGFENMFLHFNSRVTLSACTQLNCAPEDKGFDSLTQVDTDSWFTPSAVFGAKFHFYKFRAGVNVQLPFWVRSSGTVQSRLPTDPFFANAAIHGNQVGVDFDLPLSVRAGLEYRPIERLRVEADFDWEEWSMQQNFKVQPHGVYISGVPGIGNYYLNTMYVVRGLQDSYAVNIGGELEAIRNLMWLRAGYIFETSATPNSTASVLTPDATRNVITLGGRLRLFGNVHGDLGYAHVFFADRNVTNSASFQLNPIQPADAVPVGNGKYTIAADVVSLGLDARF